MTYEENKAKADEMQKKQHDVYRRLMAIVNGMSVIVNKASGDIRDGLRNAAVTKEELKQFSPSFEQDYNIMIDQMNTARNDFMEVVKFFSTEYQVEKIQLLH